MKDVAKMQLEGKKQLAQKSNLKNELVVKVKPGTKVRVVEATSDDEGLGDRDLQVVIPEKLKISVSRFHGNDFKGSPSTITMCG